MIQYQMRIILPGYIILDLQIHIYTLKVQLSDTVTSKDLRVTKRTKLSCNVKIKQLVLEVCVVLSLRYYRKSTKYFLFYRINDHDLIIGRGLLLWLNDFQGRCSQKLPKNNITREYCPYCIIYYYFLPIMILKKIFVIMPGYIAQMVKEWFLS